MLLCLSVLETVKAHERNSKNKDKKKIQDKRVITISLSQYYSEN